MRAESRCSSGLAAGDGCWDPLGNTKLCPTCLTCVPPWMAFCTPTRLGGAPGSASPEGASTASSGIGKGASRTASGCGTAVTNASSGMGPATAAEGLCARGRRLSARVNSDASSSQPLFCPVSQSKPATERALMPVGCSMSRRRLLASTGPSSSSCRPCAAAWSTADAARRAPPPARTPASTAAPPTAAAWRRSPLLRRQGTATWLGVQPALGPAPRTKGCSANGGLRASPGLLQRFRCRHGGGDGARRAAVLHAHWWSIQRASTHTRTEITSLPDSGVAPALGPPPPDGEAAALRPTWTQCLRHSPPAQPTTAPPCDVPVARWPRSAACSSARRRSKPPTTAAGWDEAP
jgi:hypothetical protein